MRLFSRASNFGVGLAALLWASYTLVQLQYFYDNVIRVPLTQRTYREQREVRLPRLYFCPADRGRSEGFRFYSFECTLSYKDEFSSCPARLEAYHGRTPEEFKGNTERLAGDGFDRIGTRTGECLEFGTHMVGVREEWSPAWNEVTLRASFKAPAVGGIADALQEIELGYLPVEWQEGNKAATVERYYYPLLRIPFFFLPEKGYADPGVATRTFMQREVDKGFGTVGRYWYTYGAMQLAVINASRPGTPLPGVPFPPTERLGVAHIVVTLNDFEEFDYRLVSSFFPFMGLLGQVAGVGAMLAFILFGRLRNGSRASRGDEGSTCPSPVGGPEYARVAPDEEEGSGEESQALLGSGEKHRDAAEEPRRRSPEERAAGQALLSTEEGLDGL